MYHGGIAQRLVRFASSAVGAVRGGSGVVNVFASMLFGGISGSAVADVSALGSILIPVMKEKKYELRKKSTKGRQKKKKGRQKKK